MDQNTKIRLLQSIEGDRLVVLCGAGLSMAAPSNLPSALQIAETCHERHCISVDPTFDPSITSNLEKIAEYFSEEHTLITHFIRQLVPWNQFVRPSNAGHNALADFLLCRAIFAVLSSNYDELIEAFARKHSTDLQVSMDGDQANIHTKNHSPLLKFHGCANNDRDHTVWVNSQLDEDPIISERIRNIHRWMDANLREKDLLIIGFWSDWSYLNNIIGSAFENVAPLSVTVVDPTDINTLEVKAPELWAKAHSEGVNFYHVQESGSVLLDELRIEFSKVFMRKVFAQGKQALEDQFRIECDRTWLEQPEMTSDDHYRWRRDAEGLVTDKAARLKTPEINEVVGFFHLLLRKEGADINGSGYSINNKNIRVINGSGRFLSAIQNEMIEPPASADTDIIVCVGSDDTGLPGNIIRAGTPGDIVRPASEATFATHQVARNILEI